MVKDWGFGPYPAKSGQKGVPKWPKMAYFGPYFEESLPGLLDPRALWGPLLGPLFGRPARLRLRGLGIWAQTCQYGPNSAKKGSFWDPFLGPF